MTDCQYAEGLSTRIDGVDDPEPPHAILPETLQISAKRSPASGILCEKSQSGLDERLDVRGKMADQIPYVRRYLWLKSGH